MKKLFSGAVVLSVGTIFTKVLGALYRVPLSRLLGAEGLGIYQMVFPFYCILLTLSSTGIPSALSKIIAEGANGKKVLNKSIICFGLIGAIGTFVMIYFAEILAKLQGNVLSALCYRCLAPSVFLVTLISCFRGYFQAKSNMYPTAVSQIVEQVVKLLVAMILLSVIKAQTHVLAAIATLAVTASELVAFLLTFAWYKLSKSKADAGVEARLRRIIAVALPVTISAILIPLSRAIDSFLVINLLPLETAVATQNYGVYSGGVESLIGVPVAVCYGLAVSAIPLISRDKSNKKLVNKVLFGTLIISVLGAIIVYFTADFAVRVLYFSLTIAQKSLMASLIKLCAVEIVFLSLMQSMSSVLISRDKLFVAPTMLFIGIVIKIITLIVLVPMPSVAIYGLAISDILCYFVATALDLLYIIIYSKKSKVKGEV